MKHNGGMMTTIDEAQSFILSNLMFKHPALVEEVDQMARGLQGHDKGKLYERLFRQPVNGVDLATNRRPEGGSEGGPEAIQRLQEDRPWRQEDRPQRQEDRPRLTVLSSEEILQTNWIEPKWAVPGLLPVGLLILAGAPKIGKSWLSLQLAKAISTGGEFLGKPTTRGKALVCALEDSPQRLQKRMNAMGWRVIDAKDEAVAGPIGLERPGGPGRPGGLEVDFLTLAQTRGLSGGILQGQGQLLVELIRAQGYQLVVIDTLSRAISGDQQDVQVMTRELTPLQAMSHELNCAVMLCDHHRKSGGLDTDVIADILGSTAKGAMADTVWSLYRERGKTGAKLAITGRDLEEQTLQLTFDKTTCCWHNLGETAHLVITDRRQDILDMLKELGRAQMDDVCHRLKGEDKGNLHRRLQDLVNEGLVRREKVGRSVFYCLESAGNGQADTPWWL